jgi:hypothetical protein
MAHSSKLIQTRRNHDLRLRLAIGIRKCAKKIPRQQLIWKIPLWCADGKAVRRPPCNLAVFPECELPIRAQTLELAKGFEPLTL